MAFLRQTRSKSLPGGHREGTLYDGQGLRSPPQSLQPVVECNGAQSMEVSASRVSFLSSKGHERITLKAQAEADSSDSLTELWRRKTLSDFVISCQGEDFPVHRVVLVVNSGYFNRMLVQEEDGHKRKSAALEGDSTVLEKCLEFMYTRKTTIMDTDLDKITSLAKHLEQHSLITVCVGMQLRDVVILNDNCLRIWKEAAAIKNDELENRAKEYALKNFCQLVESQKEQYRSSPFWSIRDLLSHRDLNVPSHEVRLTSALEWVEHDCANRAECLEELLASLPLKMMSEWFLKHVMGLPIMEGQVGVKAILTEAAEGHVAFDKTIVVVGAVSSSHGHASKEVKALCISDGMPSKTLSELPAKIAPHGGVACCVVDQKLLVSGLADSQNEAWSLDLKSLKWEKCGILKKKRECHSMVECQRKVYAVGGRKPGTSSELVTAVENVNPTKKSWSIVGKLKGGSCSTNVCACSSGSNIIICGITEESAKCTLMVLQTDSWQTTNIVKMPMESSWVYGIALHKDVVLVSSSTGTLSCPLESLYNDSSPSVNIHEKYRAPNMYCAMISDEDNVFILGGKPNVSDNPKYLYTTPLKNIFGEKGDSWKALEGTWPISCTYIVGGAHCTVDRSLVPCS